jgi:hypothetical protein
LFAVGERQGATGVRQGATGVTSIFYTFEKQATNGQTAMTTSNQFDNLNRLLRTESWSGTNLVARSAFGYNPANQRKAMTNADNTYWLYDYDFLGQVKSAKKYWPDGTLVAGQQNEYTFDDIGNRKTAVSGGDASGANKRTQYYTNNLLNQYTGRTVPGYMEVQGSANTNATVTVNLQPVYRFGDYFRKEYLVNNATGAIWLSLTNFAVLSPGGTNIDICDTNTGWAYINQTPQLFGHDVDGNLTNDGRFAIYWDGENRLTNITSLPTANYGSQVQLQFVNDYRARRTQKIVFTNNGAAYIPQYTNKFAYDENNVIAITVIRLKAVQYQLVTDFSGIILESWFRNQLSQRMAKGSHLYFIHLKEKRLNGQTAMITSNQFDNLNRLLRPETSASALKTPRSVIA